MREEAPSCWPGRPSPKRAETYRKEAWIFDEPQANATPVGFLEEADLVQGFEG